MGDYFWIAIGNSKINAFDGIFDGRNNTISGLIAHTESSNEDWISAGLFGWNAGTIKNIGISNNSHISSDNSKEAPSDNDSSVIAHSGAIAGINLDSGHISNCCNAGYVSSKSSFYAYAGGITGRNQGTVESCINSGNVSTLPDSLESRLGGVVGLNVGDIEDCSSTGSMNISNSTNTYVSLGGISGYNNNGSISNCINHMNISLSIEISGDITIVMGGIVGYNNSDVLSCHNYGTISSQYNGTDDSMEWSSLYTGGIAGSTGGEYAVISNCYNEGDVSADYNLNVDNANKMHYSYAYVGGIVGYAEGTIESCGNLEDANISASSSTSDFYKDLSKTYAGGIAGYNESNSVEILNCYNEGTVESLSISSSASNPSTGSVAYSGGIIGDLSTNGLIENCYSKIGNIIAESKSHALSYVEGSLYPSISYAGGISGRTLGKIINCFNESNVSSSNSVDVKATHIGAGFRTHPSANAGGITGALDDGDKSSNLKAETILYCYNKGNVNASGDINSESRSGGITGFMSGGTISYSYNCGEISAAQNGDNAYVGGIVGICVVFIQQNDVPNISQCYNIGRIQLTVNIPSNDDKSGLGGICGVNNGLITNSYNTASISCISNAEMLNVGGIAGYNRNSINSCYNVGDLECPDTSNNCCLGSIVGKSSSTNISNTFYINNTAGINGVGQSSVTPGIDTVNGLNNDEMINLCLLSGNTNLNKNRSEMPWSPDIFGVNDGYPVLADVPVQINPEYTQTNPEKAPKSVVYIVTNNEESQQENYLKLITLATGSKLNTSQQNSILDIFNATNPSYSWKKLIVDYDAIVDKAWNDHTVTDTSKNSLTLNDDGTYCGVITYDVSENSNPSTKYHYTTLSRTVELKPGLVYDSNDGSGKTHSVLPDETGKVIVEENMFHYNGHAFVGWKDALDTPYKITHEFDFNTLSESITLYAQWKPASPVNFNVSQPNSTIIIKDSTGNIFKPDANGKCMLPAGNYTYSVSKSGYMTETGTMAVSVPADPDKPIIIDVKLSYAGGGGIPVSYNVTYNANGGSGTLVDTNSPYHSGVTVLVLENNFTKDGYTFKNWNTKADGSGTSYSEGDRFSINSNVILYAQWEETSTPPVVQKVTVTFYIGNEVYKVIEVNANSSLKDKFPVTPESSDNNSKFKEWNTKEDASGKAFTADSVVNEDISVYAVWEKSSSSSSHSWWWIIIIIIILIIIIAAYYYYKKNQN